MRTSQQLIGAIDVGGTKIAIGLVSADGRIVTQRSLRTSDYTNPSAALDALESSLRACLHDEAATLVGIGIGCTGPVDPITGVVGKVANLPGWEGFAIVDALASRLHVSVKMENDADSAAMAEAVWGSGRGVARFLYVTLSTGIGTGFLIDGDLYRGIDGSHPEMGHHTIDPSGPACYCGARGCWESVASGTAIRDWYLEHDASGRFTANQFSAETVFALYHQGDALAQKAIERLSYYVGLGLANLTTILVPGTIAVGGGLAHGSELFLESAIAIVRSNCREVPAEKVVIRTAALRGDVGLVGAAAVWLHARPSMLPTMHP